MCICIPNVVYPLISHSHSHSLLVLPTTVTSGIVNSFNTISLLNPPPSKTVTSISQVTRFLLSDRLMWQWVMLHFVRLEDQAFIDSQGHVILLYLTLLITRRARKCYAPYNSRERTFKINHAASITCYSITLSMASAIVSHWCAL